MESELWQRRMLANSKEDSVAAGRGAYAPRHGQKGHGNFLRHELRSTEILSSVETWMGMEGEIMCVEQCTLSMSSVAFLQWVLKMHQIVVGWGIAPNTPGELTALPDPLAGFKGTYI